MISDSLDAWRTRQYGERFARAVACAIDQPAAACGCSVLPGDMRLLPPPLPAATYFADISLCLPAASCACCAPLCLLPSHWPAVLPFARRRLLPASAQWHPVVNGSSLATLPRLCQALQQCAARQLAQTVLGRLCHRRLLSKAASHRASVLLALVTRHVGLKSPLLRERSVDLTPELQLSDRPHCLLACASLTRMCIFDCRRTRTTCSLLFSESCCFVLFCRGSIDSVQPTL